MEKRAFERHEVRLSGELIWAGGAKRHACTIKDVSEDGARIDTDEFLDIPDRVFLLEHVAGGLFECLVKWHSGAQVGLYFIDASGRLARRALIQRHSLNSEGSGPQVELQWA